MEILLVTDVDPNNTTIELVDTELLTTLPSAGTLYFIEGEDYFEYTGLVDNVCTGVSGMAFYHEAGSGLTARNGSGFSGAISDVERTETFDPDDFTGVLSTILDSGFDITKEAIKRLRSLKSPLFSHLDTLYDSIRETGMDAWQETPEGRQRLLALASSGMLRSKGSAEAFIYLCYLMLGYQVSTRLNNYHVPFSFGDSYGRLYGPPQQLVVEPFTSSLWLMDVAPLVTIPNEADSGQVMSLAHGGMWRTTAGCGLFEQDSVVLFTAGADIATVSGSSRTTAFLGGKTDYALEYVIKFLGSGSYPQNVCNKAGVFDLSRHNETGLTLTLYSEGNTDTFVLDGAIDITQTKFVGIKFGSNQISVVVNDAVLVNHRAATTWVNDSGADIIFSSAFDPLQAQLESFRITTGVKHTIEFLSYYEHIRVLRTIGTDVDETTYFKTEDSQDGVMDVVVNNYDGDEVKHNILVYLAEEWLTAGENRINLITNMPYGSPVDFDMGF